MKRTSIIVPEQQTSGSKSVIDLKTGQSVLPHAKIPHADIDWALQQSPTVLRLFIESWRCDSFGTSTLRGHAQWHNLETKFQGDNFRKARKAIEKQGLFQYRKVQEVINGQRITVWQCINLHGYYSGFWNQTEDSSSTQTSSPGSIPKTQYKRFLKSDYWKQVRQAVLTRDQHQCQKCGRTATLQVHHLTYKHHGNELNHLEDLITVCKLCHSVIHHGE